MKSTTNLLNSLSNYEDFIKNERISSDSKKLQDLVLVKDGLKNTLKSINFILTAVKNIEVIKKSRINSINKAIQLLNLEMNFLLATIKFEMLPKPANPFIESENEIQNAKNISISLEKIFKATLNMVLDTTKCNEKNENLECTIDLLKKKNAEGQYIHEFDIPK